MTEENLNTPAPDTTATPALSGREGLAPTVEKKKRKYSARREKEIIEEKPPMNPEQAKAVAAIIMNSMVKPPLSMMARQYDPLAIRAGIEDYTFALGPDEETALQFSLEQALQTLPASALGKWFPWIALVITAGTMAGTRVMVAMKIKKAVAENVNEPANQPEANLIGDHNGAAR